MFGFALRDVVAFIVGCLIKLLGVAPAGRV
jgi:hypothetical protein